MRGTFKVVGAAFMTSVIAGSMNRTPTSCCRKRAKFRFRQESKKRHILLSLTIAFLLTCGYNLTYAAEEKTKLTTKKVTIKTERSDRKGKYFSFSEGKVIIPEPDSSSFDARKDIILWSINGDVEIEIGVPAWVYIDKPLDQIKEAPTTGYQDNHHDKTVCETLYIPISLIKEGKAAYCIKTEDGNHAKLNFTEVNLKDKTVTFEWVYQPDRSRKFTK